MKNDWVSISIDRAHDHEGDALLRLYVDLFYDREPLTKILGLSRERMISIARSMYAGSNQNALSRQICWIARDQAKANRNVGFVVCDNPALENTQQLPDNLTAQEKEKISAVMALLEMVRGPVNYRITAEGEKCLHVSAIGVAPEYEGRGIAGSLLRRALSDASDRGYQYAFSECTSSASRMLHQKCGFQCINSVSAQSVEIDGKYPFAEYALDIHLMWKNLHRR